MSRRPIEGTTMCAICEKDFNALGIHVFRAHGITADTYREEFGLNRRQPLASDSLRAVARTNALSNDAFVKQHGQADRLVRLGHPWRQQTRDHLAPTLAEAQRGRAQVLARKAAFGLLRAEAARDRAGLGTSVAMLACYRLGVSQSTIAWAVGVTKSTAVDRIEHLRAHEVRP